MDVEHYYRKNPIIGEAYINVGERDYVELHTLDFTQEYDVSVPINTPMDQTYYLMVFNEHIKIFHGTEYSAEKLYCLVKKIGKYDYMVLASDNNIYKPDDIRIFKTITKHRWFIPLKFN